MKKLLSLLARALLGVGLVPVCLFAQTEGQPSGTAAPLGPVSVTLTTSMGDIVLELDPDKAPVTVANFISYADKGFYDGVIFHRVISNFMIQGGGFSPDMVEKKPTDPTIINEWQNGLKNTRGSIAMARLGGQADSASSQFFINLVDNVQLDTPRDGSAYAVFGKVVTGIEVVDKIGQVVTDIKPPHADVPKEPIVISKVAWSGKPDLATLKAAAQAALTKIDAEKKAAAAAVEAAKSVAKEQGIAMLKAKGFDVSGGQTTSSGLWYADAKVGEGAQPTPANRVSVHYTGWMPDGTKFDSSHDRNSPAEFPLSGVIRGWTEGVSGMKVGGKRLLVIPPELAYGAQAKGPIIKANSTLVFEIDLLEVK